MKRQSIIGDCCGGSGGRARATNSSDSNWFEVEAAEERRREKCFYNNSIKDRSGKKRERNGDYQKNHVSFSFRVLLKWGGKKTLFFSIRQALPFVRVYGGRNSRHKSCCRPRQKTCLNYKVTRKNNQKRWPLLGSFLSLSLGYTRDPRCALLPLSSYKKKEKKKQFQTDSHL